MKVGKSDKPENNGKYEGEGWHQVADGWSKRWRAEIDACITHDLRWTPVQCKLKIEQWEIS